MPKINHLSLFSECQKYQLKFYDFDQIQNGYVGEIEDKEGYRMPFVFRPADDIKIARTLVVLHGHGVNKNYSKFKDNDWNVIVPLDIHGTDNLGSWWMGERGELQTYNLLQNLVKMLNKHFVFSSLYFWGSSMGGYGAIVHGIELGAFAVYSHIPQIKLKNTRYTDGINAKFYHPIFKNDEPSIYQDLTKFISRRNIAKSPVMFLSQTSGDLQHYIDQHFLPFISAANRKGFAFSVTMPLIPGHTGHINVAQTVKEIFEPNYRKIKKWRVNGRI